MRPAEVRRRGQAQIPGEGAGPGQLGPSAAVAAAASATAHASPPPFPGLLPARRRGDPGQGWGGRQSRAQAVPLPPPLEHRREALAEGETPSPSARRTHAPPATAILSSLPPSPSLSSPPLRPPASAAAGGRTFSDQPGEPRSIPIWGERREHALGTDRPLAPGLRKWLASHERARAERYPPTLTQPLPHRQRSPAGPQPRRAHSQRGARAGDAWHRSGGGRGCCWYCHRCHGCWPGPGPGARVSAVGLSPQPRPPSLRPLLRRAPGLLRPRLRPRSWSQAGSPGPAPRPGPCTATEPRGALGLPSPNTQPRTPPAPRHRPMPTRTLEPRSLHCRCPGDQARLSEASWIPSLPDPRTPVWASLQAPGSCPAAPVHSTTGPCASPTTWRARNPGLVSDRESMGARAMGLGAGSCSRAL